MTGLEVHSNDNNVKKETKKSDAKILKDWHVYVGTEVGLLKGVDTNKGVYNNLNPLNGLVKQDEITAMCWEDSMEKRIFTGHRNQIVKTFDCETHSFVGRKDCQVGEGPIKGICQFDNNLVTAVESGIVKLWNKEGEEDIEIDTKGNLCAMTPNPFTSYQVATGGNENDLKIWDLHNATVPIFTAKNVRNDFLDLRVPVWVTDMKFRENNKIVTVTRHHQIRLYDTKAQRRPVISMDFEQHPLMCVSLAHNEHQIVVGSSRGRVALMDLRRKLLVHVFKGFAGGVRNVHCHPTLPLVASCGLDRFLRIHDLNAHRLLKKIYLKTRLNCLVMKTDFKFESDEPLKIAKTEKKVVPKVVEVVDEEEEKMWKSMAVVQEKRVRKQTSYKEDVVMVKKKKKQKTF